MSQKHPFKKGKSKLIAPLILEGKTNNDIYDFIKENRLDEQFSKPITKRTITNIRWKMKSDGFLGEDGFPVNEDDTMSKSSQIKDENGYSFDDPKYSDQFRKDEDDPNEDSKPPLLAQRRPDWDLLSVEQVNKIVDPQTRQRILDYKTFWEQAKSEVNPDYATREQFDSFKTDMQERLSNLEESLSDTIVETLNKLKANNPTEAEVAVADDIVEVSDPSIDLETENPLDDAVDSVIELEGSIISRKTVGFTPKSLMLYDLTRKKGFRGNFADFVNSCISSALKGRKFKLTVEEDVP